MVDFNTNTTTNFTEALNNVLAASDGSIDELHAINQAILTGEGIDQIIEAFEVENSTFAKALKDNKDVLQKPDVELSQLMELDIEIPQELAEKLGLATSQTNEAKVTVNIGDFRQAAIKECLKDNKNTFGLGNLNSDTIDLLCLLLCQDSKSQIIETLKETLKSKIAERQNLSNEYLDKTTEMIKNEVEALKEAEKAKKMSILTSILSAILSVAITIASVAFTIATCGTGAAAIAVAAVAVTAAVVSMAASLASTGCTIASVCTEDQDTKEKLDKASLGLGIASAVVGLIGSGVEIAGSIAFSVVKVGANAAMNAAKSAGTAISKSAAKAISQAAAEAAEGIVKNGAKEIAEETLEQIVKNVARGAIKECGEELTEEAIESIAKETAKAVTKKVLKGDLAKFLEKISDIVTFGSSATQGATQIATGVMNIESAKTQRELANIKIEMAKLDQVIETLVAFIDALTQDIQKFMEDYLKNEQEAAEALQAKGDIELQLSQKTA